MNPLLTKLRFASDWLERGVRVVSAGEITGERNPIGSLGVLGIIFFISATPRTLDFVIADNSVVGDGLRSWTRIIRVRHCDSVILLIFATPLKRAFDAGPQTRVDPVAEEVVNSSRDANDVARPALPASLFLDRFCGGPTPGSAS
jgi:hypothetical protein